MATHGINKIAAFSFVDVVLLIMDIRFNFPGCASLQNVRQGFSEFLLPLVMNILHNDDRIKEKGAVTVGFSPVMGVSS
ncbi:hypothetical protein VNO78_22684 [Psophocarpus tetragonolobus]|uniref:Uncharacterized protein n=1 Tax=Psophocarpus tetragonolobus TaxID=3891 RepID=A0AAN9XCZ6_PSOTE